MGSMFLAIDEVDLSTHCLLRAVDIDCANADAYYYLGLVSAMRGRFEDATEFFEHTLDIRPEHVSALKDFAFAYIAMGRLTEAAEKISKARSLAGDDSQLRALDRKVWLAQVIERVTDFFSRFKKAKN